MEFAIRGRSTAAADGVDDGRRLPDPPPPHGGDANPSPVDVAALSFRRETLLCELHRGRILYEMILRELAETDRAITVCLATGNQSTSMPIMPPWLPGNFLSTPAAGRDAWRGRPSILSWEEQLSRAPRVSENTTWWCRGPSEPVVPPVYPHVERSPSPVPQQRLLDNPEKQEHGSSSGPLAIAPSVCADVELCQSFIKEPAVKEALIPALTNAVAKPTDMDLFSKKVKQQHQVAVGQEREAQGKKSHCVQLMESGIQRSKQPKHAAVSQECKAEVKDSNAVQLMEESGIQSSGQPKPAEPTTDHRINERRQSPPQYTLAGKENEKSPSDEQKRLEFKETKPKITPCGVKRRLVARPLLPSPQKKHKPEEKWSGTISQVNPACQADFALCRAVQLQRPSLAASQSTQKPAGTNTKPTPESSHGAQQNIVEMKSQSAASKWSGDISQARSASGFDLRSHLKGRRCQENTVALHGEEGDGQEAKRAYDRKDEDLRKKLAEKRMRLFCEICDVQCNSENNLESHLGGKRHRETLQGRH